MNYRETPFPLELISATSEEGLRKSITAIKLEELLGREPIIFDNTELQRFLLNKTVLVTGGGGSIGSELCRQISKVKPKKLIILDNYENNAYDIQQELIAQYGNQLELTVEIASIRNRERIFRIISRHMPQVIFHAAAHKHVPLMEACPEEAILNNIFGTYHLVQACEKYKVEKFVLISTDKAVNPTSVMGATKRFCEMILQSRKGVGSTEFVAVRFGNVLGSNGSVIPLFQKQIAQGGPVTITDKRMVRYFMTIAEAVQLVLLAGSMASSAEVYVLDMGKPVKIIDLAENLIRLSGYIPYTEIPIIETGLRPGEKLYEELLMNSEELIATANHKIYIEHQRNISRREIKRNLKHLKRAVSFDSMHEIKNALKKAVSNYCDPEEINIIDHNPCEVLDFYEQIASQEENALQEQIASQEENTLQEQNDSQEEIALQEQIASQEENALQEQIASQEEIALQEQIASQEEIALQEKNASQEEINSQELIASQEEYASSEEIASHDEIDLTGKERGE